MKGRPLICISYPGFLHRGGGVPQHIKQLQSGLEALGYPFLVLSAESLSMVSRYYPYILQKMSDQFKPPWGFVARMCFQGRAFRRVLARKLKRGEDHINVFESIYSVFPAEQPGVVVLHALVSDNVQHLKITRNQLQVLRGHEAELIRKQAFPIVTVSHEYRDWIREHLVNACDGFHVNLDVIPNGINTAVFPERPQPRINDQLNLVFAGRFDTNKNPFFLIDVMRRVRSRPGIPVHLHFIGDGLLGGSMRAAVDRHRLQDCVHFVGRLSYESVAMELQKHHALVVPSQQETFGYALLEAKLAGLRTIVRKGLTVPTDFCDFGYELDADVWADGICEIKSQLISDSSFEDACQSSLQIRQEYRADLMAQRLLNKASTPRQ